MERQSSRTLSVAFLLWPGFPLLSLAGFCDALKHAVDEAASKRALQCAWMIVGEQGEQVQASSGIAVAVQQSMGDPAAFDYIVVIGGPLSRLEEARASYWQYLQRAAHADVPLIALGSGSFILARAGLMDGYVACVHADHLKDYRTMFAHLRALSSSDYLIEGKRITCAGGVAVIELVSHLIQMHCGVERARKVMHRLAVNGSRRAFFSDWRRAVSEQSLRDVSIRQCVALMEENLEAPLSIAALASQVGLGPRQLARKFHEELGQPPQKFYRSIRLRFGRWLLLSTTKNITEIAYECGFADASHFIRGFRQAYGTSPARLRSHGAECS